MPVGFQPRRRRSDQRVWARPNGHDYAVYLDFKLAALLLHRTPPSALVRLAQLHLYAPDSADLASSVVQNLHRVAQCPEDDLLFFGVLHLFFSRRQFFHSPTVHDVDLLGSQPLRASGRVHRHVAAADYRYRFRLLYRRAAVFSKRLHQIDPR